MSNPALDQFTNAIWWKVAPILFLFGGGGILVGSLVKWLERRAARFGRERRARNVRPWLKNA